jgi:hypothetical protein
VPQRSDVAYIHFTRSTILPLDMNSGTAFRIRNLLTRTSQSKRRLWTRVIRKRGGRKEKFPAMPLEPHWPIGKYHTFLSKDITDQPLLPSDRLHSPYYNVTFQIKNVGHVYGCEVLSPKLYTTAVSLIIFTQIPQLYISLPNSTQSPPYILRGFTRASLSPEKSKTVSLTLSRYDLSIWDVVQQGWIKPQGKMKLTVGSSSRDHKLHGYLH